MATRQQYILHPCILRVIVAAFSGCWVMNVCVPLLYAVPVLIRYCRALTTLKPIGHESAEVNDEKRPSESLEFIYTHTTTTTQHNVRYLNPQSSCGMPKMMRTVVARYSCSGAYTYKMSDVAAVLWSAYTTPRPQLLRSQRKNNGSASKYVQKLNVFVRKCRRVCLVNGGTHKKNTNNNNIQYKIARATNFSW